MSDASVLIPVSTVELLAQATVMSVALLIVILLLAIVVPPIYREARTWFAPEVPKVDEAARRRALEAAMQTKVTPWGTYRAPERTVRISVPVKTKEPR